MSKEEMQKVADEIAAEFNLPKVQKDKTTPPPPRDRREMMLGPTPRWKVMDVAFGDNLRGPRRLILEVSDKYEHSRYTTCSESDGIGSQSEHSLKTLDEWLLWVDRFSDDLTGREIRDAKEAARATFLEPESWKGFRERYARTGDPWLPIQPNVNVRVSPNAPGELPGAEQK